VGLVGRDSRNGWDSSEYPEERYTLVLQGGAGGLGVDLHPKLTHRNIAETAEQADKSD